MDIEVTQQPFDLQMELCDQQDFFNRKNKSPENFWKMLSQEKFLKLRNFSLEMLSLFGRTYVREAALPTMNILQSRMRNCLDNSPESCLRLSLTRLPTDTDKNRLNHLTNYTGIIIIVLVYWF
jgi:hypothetical protein